MGYYNANTNDDSVLVTGLKLVIKYIRSVFIVQYLYTQTLFMRDA